MFTGILFAVLTGISWIWIGVVISYAARNKLNIPFLQFFQMVFGITVSISLLSGMYFLFTTDQPKVSSQTLLIAAVSTFANGFLNYFMFLAMGAAMKRGPNGIIWSIIQAGLIFPFLMGILVFNVTPTAFRIAGILILIVSVLLFGLGKGQKEESSGENAPHKTVKTWYLFAILGMVLCGINQCCGNLPSYLNNGEPVGSVYRAFFAQLGALSGWLIGSLVTGTLMHPKFKEGELKKILLFALSLNVVGLAASYLLFYNALDFLAKADAGALGYPLVVSSCIIGFFLYSALVLREKTVLLQKIAFLLGIIGIIVICL